MGKSVRWLDPLVTLEVPHHWPAHIENKRNSVSDAMKTSYLNGILKNAEIKRNETFRKIVSIPSNREINVSRRFARFARPARLARPARHINYVRITCIVIFVLFMYFFTKRMFK